MSLPLLDRPRRVARTVRRDPTTIGRFARSAWQSHVRGPLCARRRPGALAVFHVGRCGSTVLTDLLGQHPAIRSDGETYVRVLEAAKEAGIAPGACGVDPVHYVSRRMRRSGDRWFMYDLKFDHVARMGMPLGNYVAGIESAGVSHLVVLRRENLLRKLVSGIMAVGRGSYHSTDPAAVRPLRVTIDVDAASMDGHVDTLANHFDRVHAQYEAFRRVTAGRAVLELVYERDIVGDPRAAYTLACGFLGLEVAPVDVRLQRLNPFALEDVVDNLDEVESALAGTSHAWMLE